MALLYMSLSFLDIEGPPLTAESTEPIYLPESRDASRLPTPLSMLHLESHPLILSYHQFRVPKNSLKQKWGVGGFGHLELHVSLHLDGGGISFTLRKNPKQGLRLPSLNLRFLLHSEVQEENMCIERSS